MELNRGEVPLYGQLEVCAVLQVPDLEPEQTEFYVVLEGSRLAHVTVGKRTEDGKSLCFTVPGHDLQETVSVTAYCHTEGRAKPCGGGASLDYVCDLPQEVAEYLLANSDCLSPQSHLEVLRRVSAAPGEGNMKGDRSAGSGEHYLGKRDQEDGYVGGRPRPDPEVECRLREMDERITQAMANLDYPLEWSGKASQPREEHQPRDTLLHLSVRLGLLCLSRFLIGQPRGQRALTLPNEEGATPLQLAQNGGDHTLFMALATPPVPQRSPPVGVCSVWADRTCVLRVCPRSGTLNLTFLGGPESSVLDNILVLREKLTDHNILRQISALRGDVDVQMEDSDRVDVHTTDTSDGGLGRGLPVEDLTLVVRGFEEQLVLSLDDDEELPTLQTVKSQTAHPRGTQRQFSHSAVADKSASMINGRSQLSTEVDDLKAKVSVVGVTRDSSVTDSRVWDTVDSEVLQQATVTPPPLPSFGLEEQPSPFVSYSSSPLSSSADRALTRLNSLSHSYLTNQRGSPPLESPNLSPIPVALVIDSEEEGVLEKSPFSPLTFDPRSSGDDTSPDLTCTRTHSASSAGDPTPKKDMGDQKIRHRSYSYSSPKISLLPSRFSHDTSAQPATSDLSPDGVFHSVSHGRCRLQALSLSKSMSLLHPAKRREFSLSKQPQEKRELKFRKRAQSADDEGSVELAESLQHLTLSEFLKEIEEEEWDKYNIPSKVASEKYKVIRTFSFLKSRMSSTRNKNKGKEKEREKEEKDKDRQQNVHRFSTGSCAGPTVCLVCDKPATGKELLHCSSCTLMVHKGCNDFAPTCLKKLVKNRTASLPQMRDSPSSCLIATSASLPMMSQRDRRETASLPNPLSRSVPSATDRLSESPEVESDRRWGPGRSEELLQTTESSSSTDSSLGEECVDTGLHSDLAADALDYEAESWSLTVEHKFCKKQDKRVVKRQDVIYELMQTEMHHLQTLCIMAEVFRRGMREEVQLDAGAVGRVFPCLDELLLLHHDLFNSMRERRHSSAQPYGNRNYVIERIGDVLLQQFSEENAERMKQVYGDFCSHHTEAVTFFKELQQHNKRFQTFIKQQSNNYLVRRREIPECILLVTQRITKYPVLLERILQYTQEDSEEHRDLSRALVLIKEVIAAVDLRVSEFEQGQRLQDVLNRMDNRSAAKLKNGHTFRKQDVLVPGRTLKHQGLLLWKTATGRLKDVLALLLTDTLIFLQEKDQKFIFAAVDQKPPVISLQKLIVREVANEERGMFLISASAAGPEMYEVHTSSKDERNTWMRHIREAVESCPEDEEENTNESEEERRASEARAQKIQRLQESLSSQDHQICSSLEEKLQIYAELSALRGGTQEPHPEPRLLVQPHPEEVPRAAVLLTAALREAENMRTTLSSRTCSPSSLCSPHRDPLSHPVSPANPPTLMDTPTDVEASHGDPDTRDGEWSASQALVLQSLTQPHTGDTHNINLKVAQSVQSLTQLLYSLQAAVTIQDSFYEVQKLLLRESDRSGPCPLRPHPPCLQEQEKHRNQEKRREEVAAAVRLQGQLRQERQRWERECQVRHSQQGELESRLEERERQCHLEAERLKQEWEELEEQLGEYQQSLERLREGQRSVGKERERLETSQKLLQSWRHSRQRSLPVMVIPLDGHQDSLPGQSGVHLDNAGSVFVNEAAFTTSKVLNNRHVHHHMQQHQRGGSLGYGDDPRAHNSLNTILARSSQRHTLQPLSLSKAPPLHPDTNTPQCWAGGAGVTGYLYTTSGRQGTEHTPNDINTHSYVRETWSSTATVAGQFQGVPHHGDHQLVLSSLVPLETESGDGEEGGEENIVYL
ncbi:rho guanine nucleotide exchange factor 28 isoform X2 [Salmo salar]|uniref:Rho guanine nucleotide exchange factor 28 isoform X2 n=1 Tax=Salmo salar TaxID=8030 RepID=A0A1S3KXU1_SALSA|nr:rho guanine nucleotide exchange factor 28 isoform X2 [Salmo salar]